MIKHVVMFKLKDNTADNKQKLNDALIGMQGKIESLVEIEVGIDYPQGERSYDVILISAFNDKAGLATYQDHAVHNPVKALAVEMSSSIVAVDYEY